MLRHQQHRTARDLPGGPGQRCFLLRLGVQLLGRPTRDPLGDGELLKLLPHCLELLAQLLDLQLQFGPAGRDQLTKVRLRVQGHLTHPARIVRTDTAHTPENPWTCDRRGFQATLSSDSRSRPERAVDQ
ncbi:hypothetical protein OH809_05620 [Streptomyces sp. NBC_00873]|uniref:hypothetical protein n=1 Tax=unclassified Streptomyces TaxID=2593676 RepID=UPI0038668F72|nr:hypothetical protein OH809_05620 [Streptomyces sp. NBC_00873]WTA47707.1 hypothetical protein OH821_38150 [Streptomyces sp. NBC_00842]